MTADQLTTATYIILTILLIIVTAVGAAVCWRRNKYYQDYLRRKKDIDEPWETLITVRKGDKQVTTLLNKETSEKLYKFLTEQNTLLKKVPNVRTPCNSDKN